MHKRSGRQLKPEYYIVLELLNDNELFSAQEIARLKFDKSTQFSGYKRMYSTVYRFGDRNGLTLHPDNAQKGENGKTRMMGGKAVLVSGDKTPKWFGKTWKSMITDEDRASILKYARVELLLALRIAMEGKQSNQDQFHLVVRPTAIVTPEKKAKKNGWNYPLIFAASLVIFGFPFFFIGKNKSQSSELGPKEFALLLKEERSYRESLPIISPKLYDIQMVLMFHQHWKEKQGEPLLASLQPTLPERVGVHANFSMMVPSPP